jgi:hypothetical protein
MFYAHPDLESDFDELILPTSISLIKKLKITDQGRVDNEIKTLAEEERKLNPLPITLPIDFAETVVRGLIPSFMSLFDGLLPNPEIPGISNGRYLEMWVKMPVESSLAQYYMTDHPL